MFCMPDDAYLNTLGFVLLSDLKEAQKNKRDVRGFLPPSTKGNPIPKLK